MAENAVANDPTEPATSGAVHGGLSLSSGDIAASGWSVPAGSAAQLSSQLMFDAKLAALGAMGAIAPFEPVANVSYVSQGRLLILADSMRAKQAVDALAGKLPISMLWTADSPAPELDSVDTVCAHLVSLSGHLGAFEAVFNAAGQAAQSAPFDLVLDLRREAAFKMHQPPQGYFHAVDADAFAKAIAELPDMIGEFEKPKYFAYKESICAHSRSKISGCNKCIDVCSTQAISGHGDKVKVDTHLCMGCGACATVCPSGAMSYQYPRVSDRGGQLKALLGGFRLAGKGQVIAPTVLFHNATDGRDSLRAIAADGKGIPANMLPIETWHIASTGPDVLLGAIAYGAGHVALLAAGSESPDYLAALQREMAFAETILNGLGYGGKHFSIVGNGAELSNVGSAATVPVPAGFNLSNDKRGTLEFIVDHLLRHAPAVQTEIALPAGSMFGAIRVDTKTCTLCMACAGACPESALMDGGEYPRLKFLERNCVQCGLCENTCPENAITLVPRLLLTDARKQETVLNESEPYNCISCGKAIGTKLMIDNMMGKLAGHSMFKGEGQLKRLQMCADCRVVDMMANKNEMSIMNVGGLK